MNINETTEELIPLSILSLDPDVWGDRTPTEWARLLTDELFEEEFGRLCVTTTALALAAEHREQKAKQAEAAARRADF